MKLFSDPKRYKVRYDLVKPIRPEKPEKNFHERKEERKKMGPPKPERRWPSLQELEAMWAERKKFVTAFLVELGLEYPECGFDIGAGWMPPVFDAIRKMHATGLKFRLGQVKQKFCGLRIYYDTLGLEWQDDHPDHHKVLEIDRIIETAQLACSLICENCGVPHDLSTPRSGRAYCKRCESDPEVE